MKKQLLLITLLMALMAPTAMKGQGTLTIGTGTSYAIHNSNSGSPVGDTYYYYATTQSIYTASELGSAKTITSVAFYHNAGYLMDATINIYLAHTTASTVDATNPATTGTLVYTGTNIVLGSSDAEWQVFDFSSTPFEYNGTDNLLVIVCRTKKTSGSNSAYNSSLGWQFTATSGNMFMQRSSDSSGYDQLTNTSYSYTASTNRPNIQIGFTTTEPYINLDPTSEIVMTGFTKTITAIYGNVTSPTITYSSSNTSVATVSGSGTSATVTGVSAGTAIITATMNGSYTATCDITVEDPSYCTPAPTSIDGSGITNVTFGGVNNSTHPNSNPYYGDYTSQIGAVQAGVEATIDITFSTGYTYNTYVWVDLDNNYTFDASEVICYGECTSAKPNTLSLNFTIPSTQTPGNYRMRIGAADNGLGSNPSNANPCYTGTYGVFEDYTLRVEEAPSCMPPTGLDIVENSLTAHGVTMQWNAEAGETFDYAIVLGTGIDPETVTYEGSITATGTTCSIRWNNLMYGDSDYTVFIRKNCGNGDYSTAATKVIHTEIACPAPENFNAEVDGTSVTLTWEGVGTYDMAWSINPSANPDDYIDPDFQIEGSTGTMSNMALDTDYYFWVRNNCGGNDGTSTWVGPVSVHIGYCVPHFSSTGDYIDSFILGDINNTSSYYTTGGYSNHTDMTTTLEAGEPATATLTSSSGSGNHGAAIWIDFNDNLTFDDSERVATYPNSIGASATVTIDLTIPSDAAVGSHRMRVVYQYSTAGTSINPCVSASYGEAEDYTVVIATPSNCQRPTNISVEALWETANLNWTGTSNSYTVQYREAASQQNIESFFDDFENGLGNWTLIVNAEGTGWQTFNATAFQDGSNFSGNYVAMARSYEGGEDITADNWMITSQITIQPTMTYWAHNDGRSDHLYDETYDVCVSTNTNDLSDFVVVQSFTTAPAEWDQITIDLSAYAGLQGYIAFHHHDAEKDMILIDDVFIGSIEIIPAGEWQTISTESNETEIELNGLTPNTTYEYQVKGFCDDSESEWTTISTFTTLSGCTTPGGLNAEVTGNTAKLTWEGGSDTYNLQYREVDPTEPATIILTTTDIWGDGSGYQMLLDADATAYSDNPDISDYSIFEYLIPTDATYDPNTTGFVLNNSVTIQIPAGTYDWYITNPSPDYDNVYIAASNGNVGGRQNNYVFEAGKTYEFVPSMYGENDGIDVTITAAWTPVSGTVTSPYTFKDLASKTTYEVQVQGIDCDGEGSNTDWSESVIFTTPEFYIKHINAYTATGGYYLIASPLADNTDPQEVTNMLSNTYDLYRFNQSEENEWENYKSHNDFVLEPGKGYLYANSNDVDLVFTGTPVSGNSYEVTLTEAPANTNRGAWNLVGNPFTEEANIGANTAYYKMKSDGTDIESVTGGTIGKMEGVFVEYDAENEITSVTFAPGAPAKANEQLVLNVTQGRSNIDRAIVRFDGGSKLTKFQIFENTKLYIPQGTKDYAVVNAEAQGEMPISFKAQNNGSYTLSVNAENVAFDYLHLIDNMTGADIDLLETPSYSFNANTSDYASRFKLVFAQGNNSNSDEFAFISDGNIFVNGEGMLQIIDMTGRVIRTEQVNGMSRVNLNAAAGVYVLQLTNGESVKTQKIVVK